MQPETALRIATLRASAVKRPHGTRSRYLGGCKCMLCRAANSRYNTQRAAAIRSGEAPNKLVSATAVLAHLNHLSRDGVGYKSVAAAAGVSKSILAKIRNGKKTSVRLETERKVLSVDADAVADNALVSAKPTWKILDRLIDEGFTKCQLAKWCGWSAAIQLSRNKITAKSAAKVRRMAALLDAGKLRRDR